MDAFFIIRFWGKNVKLEWDRELVEANTNPHVILTKT